MSTRLSQTVTEYSIIALDVMKRRWYALLLPILIAIPLALAATKVTPTKYTAKSLILLQAEGAEGASQSRQQMMEQVAAIEAWLKSNYVMLALLPKIMEFKDQTDPEEQSVKLTEARSAINLTLLGGAAVEISLNGNRPDGLGAKLEIVLARIMEGLTGPDQGIFNAPQFVLLKRAETVKAVQERLAEAIKKAGLASPEIVEKRLQALYELGEAFKRRKQDSDQPIDLAGDGEADSRFSESKRGIEDLISNDPQVVGKLSAHYAAFQHALADYEALRAAVSPQSKNYFGVFNNAGIVIVGRPQDPLRGESPGRKIAIAIIFLSFVGAGGLILLMELFYPGVRLKDEFEQLSGFPVVARFQGFYRADKVRAR
jgi:hypothetical protein